MQIWIEYLNAVGDWGRYTQHTPVKVGTGTYYANCSFGDSILKAKLTAASLVKTKDRPHRLITNEGKVLWEDWPKKGSWATPDVTSEPIVLRDWSPEDFRPQYDV